MQQRPWLSAWSARRHTAGTRRGSERTCSGRTAWLPRRGQPPQRRSSRLSAPASAGSPVEPMAWVLTSAGLDLTAVGCLLAIPQSSQAITNQQKNHAVPGPADSATATGSEHCLGRRKLPRPGRPAAESLCLGGGRVSALGTSALTVVREPDPVGFSLQRPQRVTLRCRRRGQLTCDTRRSGRLRQAVPAWHSRDRTGLSVCDGQPHGQFARRQSQAAATLRPGRQRGTPSGQSDGTAAPVSLTSHWSLALPAGDVPNRLRSRRLGRFVRWEQLEQGAAARMGLVVLKLVIDPQPVAVQDCRGRPY